MNRAEPEVDHSHRSQRSDETRAVASVLRSMQRRHGHLTVGGRLGRARRVLIGAALALLGAFAQGQTSQGQTAQGQTMLTGPYFPPPAWDQTLSVERRFIVLGNLHGEAVLDRETGLVWERAPSTSASFSLTEAVDRCFRATIGGRLGWRLPTLPELSSLFLPDVSDPAGVLMLLPENSPFPVATNIGGYWTSTRVRQGQSVFYAISILPPPPGHHALIYTVDAISAFQARLQPWCVRGPGSVVDSP